MSCLDGGRGGRSLDRRDHQTALGRGIDGQLRDVAAGERLDHEDVRLLAERGQGRGGRPRGIGAHLTLAHQRFTVDMEDADLWLERDDVVGALLVQQVDECRHDG